MISTDAAGGKARFPMATFLLGSGAPGRRGAIAGMPIPEAHVPGTGEVADGITVLIAASGFRKSLGPCQVAAAIAEGVRAAIPSARVLQVPIIDSCEGFTEELVRRSAGTIEPVYIVGSHGEPLMARLGLIGSPTDRTAVIEVDEAAALQSLPPDRRDPTGASSRGIGQLMIAALDRGVRRITIGCGDSGANDGGIGMASALGVRFLDASRTEITEAGGLQRLAAIDMSHRDPRLDDVSIEVVVNPFNDLLGMRGVTRVHGPEKGASQAQVVRLERGLARYADVVRKALGIDVATLRGGGASGGLGAGLVAFAGARLTSRLDFMQQNLGLEASLAAADLVITAQDPVAGPTAAGDAGAADKVDAVYGTDVADEAYRTDEASQPDGAGEAGEVRRATAWIEQRARALGLPTIALAGQLLLEANETSASAVDASTVTPVPSSRDHALARTGDWLRDASASALRRILGRLASDSGGKMNPCLQPYKETI